MSRAFCPAWHPANETEQPGWHIFGERPLYECITGLLMKIVLVLLDGLGDRAYPCLKHQTPLQSAPTPNLDRLARLGSNGLLHASLPGECLPSETAHHLLFGYDLKDFPGRGLLEAVGEDVAFEDNDVLCLAHLSGVVWKDGVPILAKGRDDIQGKAEEIGDLYSLLSPYEAEGIGFRLQQTRRNDAIIVMSGRVSPFISDSDPIVVGRPMARICSLRDNPEPSRAARTAKALNTYLADCHKTLENHQRNRQRMDRKLAAANFLATQRCGRRVAQEPFQEKWGLAGMLIASGAVYGGLARELGLTFRQAKDTNDPGQDLKERIRLALADSEHEFFHVHTKVPDEAAHKGDPEKKETAIAALDQGLDELVALAEKGDDVLVAVTADHSTPSASLLIHSGEPVPLVLVGPHVRVDGVETFDEVSAAKGCLGFLRGKELLLTLLNHADRSCLMGHQLGECKRPYVPKTYEAFSLTD
jgi:2,3-bisphosphoglycerate-independent phosphoglycerate mutase